MEMNKTMKRIVTLALAVVMCMALAAPVGAAPNNLNATGAVEIDNVLTVNGTYAVLPNLTFTFEVDTTKGSDIGNWVAQTGILTNVKVAGTALGADKKVTLSYTNNDNSSSLTKGFVIDFSSVPFNAPGYYRYTVKESAASTGVNDNTSVSYNTGNVAFYYIDVYVQTNETSGNLEIVSIIVTETGNYSVSEDTDNDGYGDVTGKKNATPGSNNTVTGNSQAKFENTFNTYDLTVSKTVTGNQGDREKSFTFKVTFTGLVAGETYHYTKGSSTEEFTGGQEVTITLKHGESIIFEDLPNGATYQIVEQEATDYKTATGTAPSDWSSVSDTKTASGSINKAAASANFYNYKSGVIPTGILLTIAPFAVLMLVGLVGATVILKKRKQD